MASGSLVVLSERQVAPVLRARQEGLDRVETSLDLGMSRQEVFLRDDGILLPGDRLLPWSCLAQIESDPDACWLVEDGAVRKIHAFSEDLQRPYSLLPTDSAPTLINAGFTMHRIRRSDPWIDTQNKIRAASPIRGRVLDTTTGLGYTAIEAAKRADAVTTIELDPTVLRIARLNPWSQDLFENLRITRITGDAYDVVADLPDGTVDLVIHDPPSFTLAGELYSGEFYRQLFRVLHRNGRVFHYIGNPDSKQGQIVNRGAIRRLREAGFTRVIPNKDAFGLVAYKQR